MLKDIEQLEKEIETFRTNILASSALVQSIEAVASATKAQSRVLEKAADDLQKKMDGYTEAFHTESLDVLQKMLTQANDAMKAEQARYHQALSAVEADLVMAKEELKQSYQSFLTKLESTNVDRLFKVCQDMKKSVETKMWMLLGGVGLTALLSILSLFI